MTFQTTRFKNHYIEIRQNVRKEQEADWSSVLQETCWGLMEIVLVVLGKSWWNAEEEIYQ
jgi:hypothetical protein